MKIAVCQLNSGSDVDANLAVLGDCVAAAAAAGAAMVFMPEYALCVAADPGRLLVGRDAELIDALGAMARENRIWLHAGSLQLAAADPTDARRANASLLFGPDGAVAARYDKVHLFEAALDDGESWREADIYAPGDRLVTVPTPIGLLGLSICYDVRFPAVYDSYGRMAVDAIAVPAAFTAQTGGAHWHVLLRARAIETQSFVIAAAQTGTHDDGRQTYGHSLVVDPWGEVLLDMADGVGMGLCTIDRDAIRRARRQVPSLRNKTRFEPPQMAGQRLYRTESFR